MYTPQQTKTKKALTKQFSIFPKIFPNNNDNNNKRKLFIFLLSLFFRLQPQPHNIFPLFGLIQNVFKRKSNQRQKLYLFTLQLSLINHKNVNY